MKKQKGFIDFDGVFEKLFIVAVIIGIVLAYSIPYLWSLIKPFLHSISS